MQNALDDPQRGDACHATTSYVKLQRSTTTHRAKAELLLKSADRPLNLPGNFLNWWNFKNTANHQKYETIILDILSIIESI